MGHGGRRRAAPCGTHRVGVAGLSPGVRHHGADVDVRHGPGAGDRAVVRGIHHVHAVGPWPGVRCRVMDVAGHLELGARGRLRAGVYGCRRVHATDLAPDVHPHVSDARCCGLDGAAPHALGGRVAAGRAHGREVVRRRPDREMGAHDRVAAVHHPDHATRHVRGADVRHGMGAEDHGIGGAGGAWAAG